MAGLNIFGAPPTYTGEGQPNGQTRSSFGLFPDSPGYLPAPVGTTPPSGGDSKPWMRFSLREPGLVIDVAITQQGLAALAPFVAAAARQLGPVFCRLAQWESDQPSADDPESIE